jgi:hypothetical protein
LRIDLVGVLEEFKDYFKGFEQVRRMNIEV